MPKKSDTPDMFSMLAPTKKEKPKAEAVEEKKVNYPAAINGILFCKSELESKMKSLREHLATPLAREYDSAEILAAIDAFVPFLAKAKKVAESMSTHGVDIPEPEKKEDLF